jgi:hypothetical protein
MDVAADPRSVLLLLVDELLEASLDTVELTLERAPDRGVVQAWRLSDAAPTRGAGTSVPNPHLKEEP